MKNLESGGRKLVTKRLITKSKNDSPNQQSASKQTEARESLINLLEMEPIVENDDWAQDCRVGRLNWTSSPEHHNASPTVLSRGRLIQCRSRQTTDKPIIQAKTDSDHRRKQVTTTTDNNHSNGKINDKRGKLLGRRVTAIGNIMNEIARNLEEQHDISTKMFQPLAIRRPQKQNNYIPLSFIESARHSKERKSPDMDEIKMFYSTRYNRFPIRNSVSGRKTPQNMSSFGNGSAEFSVDQMMNSLIRFQRIQSERHTSNATKRHTPLYQIPLSKQIGLAGKRIPFV